MNWLLVLFLLILIYALVAYVIREKGIWKDHITFYGPILGLKTARVGFFDRFMRWSTVLRIYGTVGVAAVVVVTAIGTVMLVVALFFTYQTCPEPTGIYAPQNILLLPGINDFVPSTFAVWFAFVLTIAIHEFGHGILCRVEQVRVRAMGVLIAVIPIGFFVEPDEEELEKAQPAPKSRIFGAGITNNLVVGFLCMGLLLLALGPVTATPDPIIYGVYQGYPAQEAGVPQNSFLRTVGGQDVHSVEEVAALMNQTRPGDQVTIGVEKDGVLETYGLTLAAWPQNVSDSPSGFMGVTYYPGKDVAASMHQLDRPAGLLYLMVLPFDLGGYLHLLAFESPEQAFFQVPFAGYWGVIQLLFWSAWINVNVGIFNALPMVPLDGGYIMKEGIHSFLRRRGQEAYTDRIVVLFSTVILAMILAIISVPYLCRLPQVLALVFPMFLP
ncbi:MAG: site-2 protease family protein [Methanomicrobiales archaeon]|nr:site-2 protease family protein [Methanomicrobiales archaeon]